MSNEQQPMTAEQMVTEHSGGAASQSKEGLSMSKQAILDVLNSLPVIDSNGGDDAYILVANTQEVRERLAAAGVVSAANDPDVLGRYGDEDEFCILAFAFGDGYANDYQGGKLVWISEPTNEGDSRPMTAEQLDEIQKSLDAATPGPWEAKEKEVHTAKEDIEGYKTQVCKFTPSRIAASNIHLIAHAPTWLRSLLAEVQRQQGEIERLTAELRTLRDETAEVIKLEDETAARCSRLRQQLGEVVEVLEWYGDAAEEEARRFHLGQVNSNIGERAREALAKLKG